MKNQYVGDINDYHKYGLIRILTENPAVPTTVCWMLTLDDKKTDGRKIGYLYRKEIAEYYNREKTIMIRNLNSQEKLMNSRMCGIKKSNLIFTDRKCISVM
ncbi:hypothetical protein ACFLQZ_03950 [Acidobacteriota bacterium]